MERRPHRARDRRAAIVLLIAAALCAPPAVGDDADLNLYEWTAVAPIVVVGSCLGLEGKRFVFVSNEALRGGLPQGTEFLVDLKQANRWRASQADRLKLVEGRTFLLLLEPSSKRHSGDRGLFDLARGVDGARELPEEGASAIISAVRLFIEIQDYKDYDITWKEYAALLEDNNPIVLEVVLEQYIKFRRGDLELLPTLEPLLDHPRAGIRARTATLMGQCLELVLGENDDAAVEFQPALMARARRDRSIAVRIAATEAVAMVPGDRTETMLHEIADEDPEQEVRYAAEKMLYRRHASMPH